MSIAFCSNPECDHYQEYGLVQKPSGKRTIKMETYCTQCGAEMIGKCQNCGAMREEIYQKFCPNCGKQYK